MKSGKWTITSHVASNLIVVILGILFYAGVSNFKTLCAEASGLFSIISPFVYGLVIAYLLDFMVRLLERHLLHGKRRLCILLAYLLAVLAIVFLLGMLIPQLIDSVMALINNVPSYLDSLQKMLDRVSEQYNLQFETVEEIIGSYMNIMNRGAEIIGKTMGQAVNYGVAIGNGLVSAVTAIISSVYMLLDKERLLRQANKIMQALLPSEKAAFVRRVCHDANTVFGGFISGKLIDSFIIGCICFIVTTVFKVPFALLISVIIGVTNVIPFFGPFIGAVPSLMILFIVNPVNALEFLVFVIILQQFDGNILGPRILGQSTGLSALWVLVAIIVGGGLFGFAGMLIGVPTFAMLYSLTAEFLDIRLAKKGLDHNGEPFAAPEPAPESAPEETAASE